MGIGPPITIFILNKYIFIARNIKGLNIKRIEFSIVIFSNKRAARFYVIYDINHKYNFAYFLYGSTFCYNLRDLYKTVSITTT